MDALELAIHCSSLVRPMARGDQRDVSSFDPASRVSHIGLETSLTLQSHLDESECENHFRLCGMCFSKRRLWLNRVSVKIFYQ